MNRLLLLIIVLVLPSFALAHRGGPPFVKINGQLTKPYPVQVWSVSGFTPPQEVASVNWRVGEELNLEIDRAALSLVGNFPPDTEFSWDLGDGTKDTGQSIKHTYKQGSSYEVNINATSSEVTEPTLIESFLINVLPNYDYQLPGPVLKVNGQQSQDPVSQAVSIDMGKEIEFRATDSKVGSAKITAYFWDLGDGQSSKEPLARHTYSKTGPKTIQVMVRVKDENGFYADSYVWIKDKKSEEQEPKNANNNSHLKLILGLVVAFGLIGRAIYTNL